MSAGNGIGGGGIEALEVGESAWITVLSGDGTPFTGSNGEPWRVKVCSPNSLAAVRAQRNFARRVQAIQQRTGNEPTDVEFLEITWTQMAEWVQGWTPQTRGGEQFEYSHDNALWLCTKTTVGEQINRFFGRLNNFLLSKSESFLPSPDTFSRRSEILTDQEEAR